LFYIKKKLTNKNLIELMNQSVLKSKNKEMDKLTSGRRKSTPTKNGFKFDHFFQTAF